MRRKNHVFFLLCGRKGVVLESYRKKYHVCVRIILSTREGLCGARDVGREGVQDGLDHDHRARAVRSRKKKVDRVVVGADVQNVLGPAFRKHSAKGQLPLHKVVLLQVYKRNITKGGRNKQKNK